MAKSGFMEFWYTHFPRESGKSFYYISAFRNALQLHRNRVSTRFRTEIFLIMLLFISLCILKILIWSLLLHRVPPSGGGNATWLRLMSNSKHYTK